MVHAYVPDESIYYITLQGQKNCNCGQILTFWRLLYPAPFTSHSQIWYASVDPSSTCQISSQSVYSVAFKWRKSPNFVILLEFDILYLWYRQLAACGDSWMWVHNYKPCPVQWYQNSFCTPRPLRRNRAQIHKRDVTSVMDTHTHTVLAAPAAVAIQALPNLAWW